MQSKKRLSLFSEEEKRRVMDKIVTFFLDQREEEIGLIAAQEMLDFIEQDIVPLRQSSSIVLLPY